MCLECVCAFATTSKAPLPYLHCYLKAPPPYLHCSLKVPRTAPSRPPYPTCTAPSKFMGVAGVAAPPWLLLAAMATPSRATTPTPITRGLGEAWGQGTGGRGGTVGRGGAEGRAGLRAQGSGGAEVGRWQGGLSVTGGFRPFSVRWV